PSDEPVPRDPGCLPDCDSAARFPDRCRWRATRDRYWWHRATPARLRRCYLPPRLQAHRLDTGGDRRERVECFIDVRLGVSRGDDEPQSWTALRPQRYDRPDATPPQRPSGTYHSGGRWEAD